MGGHHENATPNQKARLKIEENAGPDGGRPDATHNQPASARRYEYGEDGPVERQTEKNLQRLRDPDSSHGYNG